MTQWATPFHGDWIVDSAAPPYVATARPTPPQAFFANFWGKLRRRWLLLAAITLILVMACVAATLSMPKTFRAINSVIIDARQTATERPDQPLPEMLVGGDSMIASEIEIITSREVLARTVQALHLTSDPEFNPSPRPGVLSRLAGWGRERLATLGLHVADSDASVDPAARDLNNAIGHIYAQLSVKRVGLSRAIQITFSSLRPDMAARVANTIAEVYTAMNHQHAADLWQDQHQLIQRNLADLRDRASQSALAVERFRAERGLMRGKDSTVVQEQLSQVSAELMRARTQRVEAETAVKQMRTTGLPSMVLTQNMPEPQLIGQLRDQAAQLSVRYAELMKRYGSDYPLAAQVGAELNDINHSIAMELARLRQTLDARLAVAQATEATLTETLDSLKARAGEMDVDTARLSELEHEADADRDLYTNALNRWRQTDSVANFEIGNVWELSPAVVPTTPDLPSKKLLLPAGFLFSLGAGVLGVLAVERRRPGLLSTEHVEQSVGLVPLGLTPFVPRKNGAIEQIFDDAISLALARILLPVDGHKPRSLLVTSALPQEGKTTIAIAIARVAAAQGMKVLLVDADLRSRSLSFQACREPPRLTLSDLLLGNGTSIGDVVFTHPEWGVSVLPAGAVPAARANPLGSAAWGALQQQLVSHYDLVIIDSPPVLLGGDAWFLARHADITVLLSRWRSTSPETVGFAVSQLASAHARLAGVLLTMVSTREYGSYGQSDAQIYSPLMKQYYRREIQDA